MNIITVAVCCCRLTDMTLNDGRPNYIDIMERSKRLISARAESNSALQRSRAEELAGMMGQGMESSKLRLALSLTKLQSAAANFGSPPPSIE